MRFIIFVKASQDSEAGVPPSQELVTAMMKFNEDMAKAGVLLAADGLHPSSKGARVKFSGGKRTVIDGPFAETKELVAGFWMIDVRSMEEAIEWVRRVPEPMGDGEEAEIEIRQVIEMDEWPEETVTPETAARERAIRDQLSGRSS